MKMYTTLPLATAALLVLSGCQKESAAASEATLAYAVKTTNRSAVVPRSSNGREPGATIEWTSGSASPVRLKFEAKNNSGEVEYKQSTTQQIDLFATGSVLGNITIPAGTYNEVEFKAYLAPAGSSPALMLLGSYSNGAGTKAVSFIVNTNAELKAEKTNVTVAAGERYTALNTLDLSQLTRGISAQDLNSAALSNGTIVLSASSNTALYNQVLHNLHSHHGQADLEHD